MSETYNTKRIVVSALLIALTCISTMIIKVPTPSFGYIHPGDGFVLLCGFLLGPGLGALCAGLGSALADLFSGYMVYAPATFVIKALCALVAALIMKRFSGDTFKKSAFGITLGGIVGELIMVALYFLYEATILGATVGSAAALAGVPFNMVQGGFGVIISSILYPIVAPAYKKAFLSN